LARPTFAPVGPADPHEQVRVVVKVRPKTPLPDPDVLGAIRPSQRPGPATYADHATSYGANYLDIDAVVAFAHRNDLTVEEADAASRLIVLSGSVAAMSAAFGVELETYHSEELGESYRGRVGPVYVPADLAGVVTVVTGLDNRRQVKPRVTQTPAKPHVVTYSPIDLAEIYAFPANLNGAGQCIGILEFGGGYAQEDLDHYFTELLHLPTPRVSAVSVDGTSNAPGSEADVEVVLDIEVAGGVCPGATIAVYFSQFTAAGWVEAITKAVHDTTNRPSVISVSWGYAELHDGVGWTLQVMNEINTTLKEAANLGITVLIAAGDDGSIDGIKDGHVHADFPASSPYVLAVGGTTLHAKKNVRVSEVVWSAGIRSEGPGHGSTGGGVSDVFAVPAWQSSSSAHVPAAASTGFVGRGYPDVAAVADGRTGYLQYVDGQQITDGGTSAATPLWAALIARCNQHLATLGHGAPVGYWNPLLYASVGSSSAFFDITVGTNDALGNEGGAYTAAPGWDACSGWGTPNGSDLLNAL
jgi:kumamolisin